MRDLRRTERLLELKRRLERAAESEHAVASRASDAKERVLSAARKHESDSVETLLTEGESDANEVTGRALDVDLAVSDRSSAERAATEAQEAERRAFAVRTQYTRDVRALETRADALRTEREERLRRAEQAELDDRASRRGPR